MDPRIVKTSKFLSFILRHKPEAIGLTLDHEGWADIDALLAAARSHRRKLDRALLERTVAENDKKRFIISPDGKRIRASQGHSLPVDLGLEPVEPPELLFHGTVQRFLESISEHGLQRGNRHHVHLSSDEKTAISVGQRRGKPVVLVVRAGEMHAAGHAFFLSANKVWLTEVVPKAFIDFPES